MKELSSLNFSKIDLSEICEDLSKNYQKICLIGCKLFKTAFSKILTKPR